MSVVADAGTKAKAYLDPLTLAMELNLKPQTLAAWRCRGGGPPFIRMGSAIRYSRKAIDAWLAANTASSTSEFGVA